MAHLIEGEWKNFVIKMIGKEDFPAVFELLRKNFYIDEPLNKCVGTSETRAKDIDAGITGMFNNGAEKLSFAAFDKDSGKIAAACINYAEKKDHNIYAGVKFESVERRILVNFVEVTEKASDIFEKYGIEEYGDIYAVSVDNEYRRQGLAFEMTQRSVLLMKGLNLPAVKSLFTSPYTRHIALKLGFEELARRYFREMQNLEGDYICPDAGDDDYFAVMSLKF